MDAALTSELVKFLLVAAAWPAAFFFDKSRRPPLRRWPNAWNAYAASRGLERNPRYLEGEVSSVNVAILPTLLSSFVGVPLRSACASAVVTARRTSRDEPAIYWTLESLPASTPELARLALEKLACPFELHATPNGVRLVVTLPTFDDLDHAAEAVAQLARDRPQASGAYR